MKPRVERWKRRLYDPARGWIDGSTRFAQMVEARLRPDTTMLDLGAGPGKGAPVQFRGRAGKVVGVDPDHEIRSNQDIDFGVRAVAEALPFRDESFDLVLSDWVLEHLPAPELAAREIHRILRPGGTFVFRTGNARHYVYRIAALTPHWFHRLIANRARGLPSEAADPHPTFYRVNRRRRASEIFRAAGFAEDELTAIEPEPSYLVFSTPTFLLGAAYERVVNAAGIFADFRACLLGAFRKIDERERIEGGARSNG